MRILVDVDGVCCKMEETYLKLVYQATGKMFSHEQVTEHDYFKCLHLTTEEYNKARDLLFQPGVVRGFESIAGVYEGIAKIESLGHEIVFVTSPYKNHPTWAHEREQWIHERWPDRIIISTKAKYMVAGDVLIEDKASNIEKWVEHCRDRKWHNGLGIGLLYDQPWNQGMLKGGLGVRRVFNWNDIVFEISRLIQ